MDEKCGFKVVGVHVDGQFDTEDFKKTVFQLKCMCTHLESMLVLLRTVIKL